MNQCIFPEHLAEKYKECSGQKYRPSNQTEGDSFMERWCNRCIHDEFNPDNEGCCEILTRTMFYDKNDPEYPEQWQYGKDGQPKCTAFEAKKKHIPVQLQIRVDAAEGEMGSMTVYTLLDATNKCILEQWPVGNWDDHSQMLADMRALGFHV